ncbi:MAG: ERF family protein [Spirochaetaceae bacterium]|nr:ERF family protein [Spirochaetaceae bacterium]
MNQSEKLETLLSDLAKAQAEFPTLPKDKNGYNYKYTDLDTVISTLRPILAKHNIGFIQTLTTAGTGMSAMTTRLFNASGEWLEDTTPLPGISLAKGNAAQNLGAAITYMKRYTLCAMLGVSCDEDPDGKPDGNPDFNARNQNNKNNQKEAPKPPKKGPAGGPDTPEQQKRIKELLDTKSPSGVYIFKDIRGKVGQWRMERTADQVIKYLEEEKAKLIKDDGDAFPEDIPYDESPLSKEEEAAASAAFETN